MTDNSLQAEIEALASGPLPADPAHARAVFARLKAALNAGTIRAAERGE